MIDGAGLEGPRRLSPPQLTPPEKSCCQSMVWPSITLALVPSTSCRSRIRVIGSAMSAYLL